MKIGILTFVRSMNYGSFLQCYSLYSTLVKNVNADVKVINYSSFTAEVGFFVLALLRGLMRGLIQFKIFKSAVNNSLELTDLLISNNLAKSTKEINKLKFDLIIAGSDEIWKIDKFRKYPNVYWHSSGLDAVKVSYAASGNRTTFDNLPDEVRLDIQKELMIYRYIGVRDKNTAKQLKQLNIEKEIHDNCDPTFCYSFIETPELTNKLRDKYKLDLKKPIIGLVTSNKTVGKLVNQKYSKSHQVVSITCNNKYADVWLYDLTPFEWANIFSYFSGCVTGYFHGTIFSILNRIPFVSFDYEKYSLSNLTKIYDLLEKAKLNEDCYCNILKESPRLITEKLENNILNKNNYITKCDIFITNEREKYQLFEKQLKLLIQKVKYEQ